jgi:transcriptional regulator with XRE-family HTH domain
MALVTGGELRQIRRRLGLSQREFAPRVGLQPNSLARLERDERQVSETLAILARLLARDAPQKRRRR